MTIKEMTTEQLKALIYDHLCNSQASQRSIQTIEQELASRQPKPIAVESPKEA